MPIIKENLWRQQAHPGLYVVTTNSSIVGGRLIMGAGAAKQASIRIPNLDLEAAQKITEWYQKTEQTIQYNFLIVRKPRPKEKKYGIGIFQVKQEYDQPAIINLIALSLTCLRIYAYTYPEISIRMNYPGIGCGKLPRNKVGKLLVDDAVPTNVTICYY